MAKTDSKDVLAVAIAMAFMALILPVMLFPLALIDGWVLSRLWDWHVAVTFGVRRLGVLECWGVALCVRYLTTSPKPQTDEEQRERWYLAVIRAVAYTTGCLVMGYICWRLR